MKKRTLREQNSWSQRQPSQSIFLADTIEIRAFREPISRVALGKSFNPHEAQHPLCWTTCGPLNDPLRSEVQTEQRADSVLSALVQPLSPLSPAFSLLPIFQEQIFQGSKYTVEFEESNRPRLA